MTSPLERRVAAAERAASAAAADDDRPLAEWSDAELAAVIAAEPAEVRAWLASVTDDELGQLWAVTAL